MERSNKMLKGFLVTLLAAGIFVSAEAQRGSRGGGARVESTRGYRGGGGSPARVFAPSVAYNRGYNSGNYGSRVYSRGYSAPVYQGVRGYAPAYGGNYYRSGYYGSGYYGPNYYGIPHGSISINFGGNPYYYSGGLFYRPFGGYYRTVFPPIGLRIGILPYGYMPLYVGPDLYYFNNGTYYRQYDDRNYEVVDAPMGAQVSSLPRGAKSVSVNGEKFYELNGTYYKEDRDAKGRTVYTVVGKNGEIENSQNAPAPTPGPQPSGPRVGDRVSQLPDNCKVVTINGQKMYVSPDNTYYQPDNDGNYSIVGLPNSAEL